MKRCGPLRRTPLNRTKKPLQAKSPMKKVSKAKAAYRASDEGKAARQYMTLVKQLPCAVCGAPGPSDAHHPQSGRYGNRRASDFDVIPLCPPCHRQEYGPGAYHYSKREWEAANGPDHGFIEVTRKRVGEMV